MKYNGDKVIGAKLEGSMEDYLNIMKERHIAKNRNVDCDDMIIISSFDGAEIKHSKKQKCSVISFSSSMFTASMLNTKQVTAGQTSNILTWQQVLAKEDKYIMQQSSKDYFRDRKRLLDGNSERNSSNKIFCYDCHDGKMIYQLLQCSMWNRKHSPFIICKCSRNEGVENNGTHQCNIFSDQEYEDLWNRSKRRWQLKATTEATHRDWCDLNNFGVTHFGIHPSLFPISTIRFDVFHLCCSVTKMIMGYIRGLILKQSSTLKKEFSEKILMKIWNDFLVVCWNSNMKFNIFQGNELSVFVSNIKQICCFMNEHFQKTDEIVNFTRALSVFPEIFSFVKITYIHDKETYKKQLELFENNVAEFYACGRSTFLANGKETFYCHALRYYSPVIAKDTFERHGLGIGIFSMQGFERRNKESKNMASRFLTNNIKSPKLLVNNLRRLFMKYFFDIMHG
jgi:hypothetical protein